MTEWTTVKSTKSKKTRIANWRDHAKTSLKVTSKTTHPLNETWVLWYHDASSDDWSLSGYEQLYSFDTIEDFWVLYNNLHDITNGMYYLMRKSVPPIWDAPENIDGGAWTFRVDKKNLTDFWLNLSLLCIGETICENSESILGISFSPKLRFATVRVWTSQTDGEISQFNKIQTKCRNTINFTRARFTLNNQLLFGKKLLSEAEHAG